MALRSHDQIPGLSFATLPLCLFFFYFFSQFAPFSPLFTIFQKNSKFSQTFKVFTVFHCLTLFSQCFPISAVFLKFHSFSPFFPVSHRSSTTNLFIFYILYFQTPIVIPDTNWKWILSESEMMLVGKIYCNSEVEKTCTPIIYRLDQYIAIKR